MKNGQIFAYKSTNRGAADIEYLDETSQRKQYYRQRSLEKTEIGKKLKAFADYASKESLGQVHVGGFLHNMVRVNRDGTSTSPALLSNEERKQRIVKSWMEHLDACPSAKGKKRKVIQHRLVFSMSTEQHNALVAAGMNPDQVLHATMKKIMEKFNDKFHRRDSIGYAYGFHHDTDNLHVHVALCPRTRLGKYVGCSKGLSKQARNKGQMDYLRECFELENKIWEKRLSNPHKLDEYLWQRLDSHKIIFNPRLTFVHRSQLVAEHNEFANRLDQMHTRINALELECQRLRSAWITQKQSQSSLLNFLGGFSKKSPCLIPRTYTPYQRVREHQQALYRLKHEYRREHNKYRKLYHYNDYGAHQTEKNRIYGYRNTQGARLTAQ